MTEPILTEEDLEAEFEIPDNSAAREHLAAGRPIVYREQITPAHHIVKRYPDGRRELVSYKNRKPVVVAELSPVSPELKPAKYDPKDLISGNDE